MNRVIRSGFLWTKLARRSLRRMLVWLRYGSTENSPILFANSFPKSGTHLLTQILFGFTKLGPFVSAGLPAIVTYDGPTGVPRRTESLLIDLNRLKHGDIAYGHLHAYPDVMTLMTQEKFVSFFVFRDPRDVVVSHVHYVTEIEKKHVHHEFYTKKLKTFDERLEVSILGIPDLRNPFPDIEKRFKPYLGWLTFPNVLSLRFEDIIQNQKHTLARILDHVVKRGVILNCPWEDSINILGSMIKPMKSPTFRSGKIGGWKEYFKNSHKSLFKEIAGELLITLEYEKDLDW